MLLRAIIALFVFLTAIALIAAAVLKYLPLGSLVESVRNVGGLVSKITSYGSQGLKNIKQGLPPVNESSAKSIERRLEEVKSRFLTMLTQIMLGNRSGSGKMFTVLGVLLHNETLVLVKLSSLSNETVSDRVSDAISGDVGAVVILRDDLYMKLCKVLNCTSDVIFVR
mgnify:CR=1 FL=1